MWNYSVNTKTHATPAWVRLVTLVLFFGIMIAQVPVQGAQAQTEQLILTKSIEGGSTTARVGEVLRYRIRFECSSLTGPCGQMEITDVLQPGLTYQPPPASSVPAGFTIAYNAGTRTITITKDDNNLLDGSQYDAVIAVVVDYDLRPLPATINNTVGGRIRPSIPIGWITATPSSAPPITIGTANPYWGMTKSLASPLINPTVNTDVTYRLQLCPTTPPPGEGNVPLRDIVFTDTLPAGATFVSASNGGTYSIATGIVTWPNYAGPLYPPNCLTRYVTIRYVSVGSPPGPFNIGDSITNTASANGTYTDSGGGIIGPVGVGTDPILHPIEPIAERPSYSKGDTGDPVGLTGTGRFTLDLNTNATNYPSNELILIDNLPPELQVTSVTSGAWDASFDFVSATVEYSANNGVSYTPFPGQPITYNTNATYSGLPGNITNVRWVFAYDPDGTAPFNYTQPGLPYTWSFTTRPQIRVRPRLAAAITDPPVVALPAAEAGNTYNNCLQVIRRDSAGNPVTDPCDLEPMTVEDSVVSLRVSKNETPGEGWDDVGDPQINTFMADSSILPGDTVRYTLTVELTERSSTDLINPTIQDTLPPVTDFVFVRSGMARLDGVVLVGGQQPSFTQAGQVLTWAWNNPSPALSVSPLSLGSHTLTVEFFGYVPRGKAPGTYINDLFVVTDSPEVICEIGSQPQDSGDIDMDADTTEFGCRNPDPYVVERSAALRGEKWIRSTSPDNSVLVNSTTFLPDAACPDGGTIGLVDIPTNSFTRYPCISQAFPEGALSPGQHAPPPTDPTLDDFEYNLRIFNDGNVNMLEYVLYDILPYVGDTGSGGTLSGQPRQSAFRPMLSGPIEFIRGPGGLTSLDFTIEYNNTTNPCRPEVFNQPLGAPVPAGCNNTWLLATAVTDWTQVRSYRIRLKNDGTLPAPSIASAVPAGQELRFGVPMYIPFDAPPAGFDPNDALTREIAWNSYSHVGSYDKDPSALIVIQDLLASEPRKVGITVPEVMSVGNRVWRDSDNSGTINPPDDSTPGIPNVEVNLYRDVDNNGIADGPAIGTTITDTGGYYLFSNIPYDSVDMDNNRYIIGIPASNFGVGQPLENLRSSTGTPASATFTTPTSNVFDSADDGIDTAALGLEVFSWSFTLQPGTEPFTEADLSNNNRDGLPGQRRGVNGELNNNSDLTIDFGFFGGMDVPFSIGNHVWKDNGQTAPGVYNYAQRNDGIRQITEPPVVGARVELYRDGNANGILELLEMIRWDITDAEGFYLFDNLDPGPYYVLVPAGNFTNNFDPDGSGPLPSAPGVLRGWYSSVPTGAENVGVPGNTNSPNMDSDDNGVNVSFPENTGVRSDVIVLTRGDPEAMGESHLSTDSGSLPGFNPTEDDGPQSIGRFLEDDDNSNVTIDFGFIPPMSLGNRVWFDDGAGSAFRVGYNNGVQDGTEVGVNGVPVELWRDNGNGTFSTATDTLMYTTSTDATGYYLFERFQPGNYFVRIPTWNFSAAGRPLRNYISSNDSSQATAPADDTEDMDDNGIDNSNPASNGITSSLINMSYNGEPLTPPETDIIDGGAYGPMNRGNYGQADNDSNLTIDFGFVRPPRSIGNRLWIDANNNGVLDGGELPVPTGVRVSLYLDGTDAINNVPDDLGVIGDRTDDWIAFDLTDAGGYYLFDNLPPGTYIVGVDRLNFAPGGLLEGYNSSRGSVDNASNNTNQLDNGVDRLFRADPVLSPHGILSTRINLTAVPSIGAPTNDDAAGTISSDTGSALGFNPTVDDGPNSRGRYGETDDNSDLTLDFGFFIPMSIGNRVFRDDGTGGGTYNNGIMDGGELPIANVRVELYHDLGSNGTPDGPSLGFDVTDSNGYYLFDDLAAGSYIVLIPGGNFTNSFDPDGAGPLPTAPGALLGYNSSTPTGSEDSGVLLNPYSPNTDRDDNGINNGTPTTTPAATPGILSGTINLVLDNEPTGETELSGQGDPGSPANVAFNPTGWDGPVPGSRGRWEESDDSSNLTIDFGFIPVFSLGNRVWFDTDNESDIDAGEQGVDNVIVRLYSSTGTQILVGADGIFGTADDLLGGEVTTNANGYYLFNNLPAGDYVVVLPASNFTGAGRLVGYWSSATLMNGVGVIGETPAALANSDLDSDDNGTLTAGNVISSVVTLGPTITSEPPGETDLSGGQGQPDQQANMTVDFGFYRVEVGNLVYMDNNANGNYDGAPDTVVVGRTVQLFAADGTTEINVGPDGILGSGVDIPGGMVTAPVTGTYLFSGLPQGQYIVRTSSTAATASTIDTYNAAGDNPNPNINADNNDNGMGILSGPVSSGAVTLTPGSAGALGSNTVTQSTGTTSNPTVDFGFVGYVALGNRVWIDDGAGGGIYNNGIMDGGEAGVNNVTVQLYTSAGTFVSSTVTADSGGSAGYYQFDMLYPGTYYAFIPAAEFQAGGELRTYYSSFGNGVNETNNENTGAVRDENGIDNPAPATNGIRSTNYNLIAGDEVTGEDQTNYTGTLLDGSVNFTADFGFVQKYSIANRVWFDTDNESDIDAGEQGVNGVVINLYAASDLNTILATDTTANGGYYLFDDLFPGNYVVSVAASNFNAGGRLAGYWSSGTSRPPSGALTETPADDANTDNDDTDDNGTRQTAGPLNGAVISSAVTLGPAGNTEPTLEGDLEGGVGQGNQEDGRANMTVDFGFYTMSLGNLVWSDIDKNGGFNSEPVLDGISVELWSGDGSTLLASTISAGGGLYNFPGLAEGNYTVRVTAPTGTASSVDTFASADTTNPTTNTDNNDNGVGTGGGTVVSNPVTLDAGAAQTNNTVNNAAGSTFNPTMDFGFNPVFSLGNRVWFDTDNENDIDAGEQGVDGVIVNLYAASDLTSILGIQTTANGGYYLFNNLQSGDYVVAVDAGNFNAGGRLAGYWSSGMSRTPAGAITETTAALANSDLDSDDNGTRQTSGDLIGAVISSVVTLGPAINAEPAGEGDLNMTLPGNHQAQPDQQANMTVDFGFYTITLGDLVWNDVDNSGLVNAESGINNVTVELRSGDNSTSLGTTTTNGSGIYTFSGLPTGDYIIRLPASNFNPGGTLRDYRSSTGPLPALAYEPAPDADIDTTNSDDNGSEANGLLGLGGYIQTLAVSLTPAAEESFDNATGRTIETRVDLGVNNSPQIDLTVTKTDNRTYYIANGVLNYVVVITNNGPADANGMTVSDARPPQITSWTWTCAAGTPAAYNCTGDATNPATFTDSLDLPQLASVTYNVEAHVGPVPAGNLTNSVTVTPPAGMTDMTSPDNTDDDTDVPATLQVTKDDGIFIVGAGSDITYQIVVTNTGAVDMTSITVIDTLVADLTYKSASPAPTAIAGQQLTWSGISLAAGASTTINVTATVSNTPSASIPNTVDVVDVNTNASDSDYDVDAAVVGGDFTKSLIATNHAPTDPQVTIGEILTYEVAFIVPPGRMDNVLVVDTPQPGLAFVDCVSISLPGGLTSTRLSDGVCNTGDGTTPGVSNPLIENAGGKVTFDFGTVQNTGAAPATVTIRYTMVVLDVPANQSGGPALSNLATWTWTGGDLHVASTSVDIVEPDMFIDKNTDITRAPYGATIPFTLDIGHTAASSAHAYDVVVTDVLPTGLAFIPGTIVTTGLPPTTTTYDPVTFALTFTWDEFELGETAKITFEATFIGPSPVTNASNVYWTSLPIDPVIQSLYNPNSTERWYDPTDLTGLNGYGASDSIIIQNLPPPNTGFAPNVITELPAQPNWFNYTDLGDFWIEIPQLGVKLPIVGVPLNNDGWNLTWLGNQAGWLEGSAYPTHAGNSVITAHVFDADGKPGAFVDLHKLYWGHQIIIHLGGQKYTYEVRDVRLAWPDDRRVFHHEEYPWLTLITCKDYNERTDTYAQRVVVRAVLLRVEDE